MRETDDTTPLPSDEASSILIPLHGTPSLAPPRRRAARLGRVLGRLAAIAGGALGVCALAGAPLAVLVGLLGATVALSAAALACEVLVRSHEMRASRASRRRRKEMLRQIRVLGADNTERCHALAAVVEGRILDEETFAHMRVVAQVAADSDAVRDAFRVKGLQAESFEQLDDLIVELLASERQLHQHVRHAERRLRAEDDGEE